MLQKLYIKNFAIIDEINLNWQDNLSVITGETGAGKSIILGALNLILGKRADHSVILNREQKCIIEAHFYSSKSSSVNKLLKEKEYEIYDDLIIRREISPSGRSRAFINDTPATLEDITIIGRQLVDMHRQFDNYELLQPSEQLLIIDNYLLLNEERTNYTKTYDELKSLEKSISEKEEISKKAKAEQDYLQFVFDEIKDLNLNTGDIEKWEGQVSILENAHQIKEHLIQSADQISNNENAIISALQIIQKGLQNFSAASQDIENLTQRLGSTIEELKDISAELEIQESNISTDEEELTILNEKLEFANKLLLKHSVNSTESLIELRDAFAEKLESIVDNENNLSELYSSQEILKSKSQKEADQLSKKRISGIKKFTKAVNTMLPELGFINAKFDIQHSFKTLSSNGIDDIEFRFDANNTGKMQPIQKSISGGEMSRVMLIIKSMLAHNTEMPCMIFDEIDTGISGEIALKVGKVLKELSQKHQVISITHLPQIAAKAQQHLYVYKDTKKGSNSQTTKVRLLSNEERVQIIAEMLSGKNTSTTAKETAIELLNSN